MVSSAPRSRHARVASALAGLVMLVGLLPAGVAAAPPSGSPTLLSPTEGQTVSSNPTFSWTAVGGAVKYRVQVSTSPSFSPLVYNVDTVNRKATPPADLPLGFLYWRVAATDGGRGRRELHDRHASRSSGARRRRSPRRTSTTPSTSRPQPVLFRWQPLAGAKSYTLEIDDAPDFIGATSFTTNNTNFTLTEPPTISQTFYWRLRATSSTGGVVTDWSPDPPVHLHLVDRPDAPDARRQRRHRGPATSSSVGNPVVGAKTYELQVSPNGDWANNLAHRRHGQEHEVLAHRRRSTTTVLLAGPSQGREEHAEQRRLVDERQFTRDWPQHPDEVAPFYDGDHDADRRRPDTRVDPGAARLALRDLDRHRPAFSPGIATTSASRTGRRSRRTSASSGPGGEPGGCTFLHPGTTYYWKVRAIDAIGGIIGIFSEMNPTDTWRFIYISELPNLVAPPDNGDVRVADVHLGPRPEHRALRPDGQEAERHDLPFTVTTYATSFTPADGPQLRPTAPSRGMSRRSTATATPASSRRVPTGSTSR